MWKPSVLVFLCTIIGFFNCSFAESLCEAAGKGYLSLVISSLENGANINEKDADGATPLASAVWNGRDTIAKYLVEKGASLSTRDNFGNTLLMYCASKGNLAITKYLVEKGCLINVTIPNSVSSPASIAFKKGNIDIWKYLILHGADVNSKMDSDSNSYMSYVVSAGIIDLIRFLFTKNAYPDSKNKNGETPLMVAAQKGYTDIVTLLLDHGASAIATNSEDRTPLMFAASGYDGTRAVYENEIYGYPVRIQIDHVEVARILIGKKAKPKEKDLSGKTAYEIALESQHIDNGMVDFLSNYK